MSEFDNHEISIDDINIANTVETLNQIPDIVPILPLRGLVVYPRTAIPLTIGQPRSIKLIDDAMAENRLVGLVTSKFPESENPKPDQLHQIGTIGIIHRMFRAPDGTIRLLIQGVERFKVSEYIATEPYLKARIKMLPETVEVGLETEALISNVRKQFEHVADLIPSIPKELVSSLSSISDPLITVYTIANFQRMDIIDAQSILELNSTAEKFKKLLAILARETEVLELGQKIQNDARSEIEKIQRDYFLREQLKAIQRELGENDEQSIDISNFKTKIEEAHLPEEAEKQAKRELDRLSRLPIAAAEYGVIRTYLDWLVSLPWSVQTKDKLVISNARKILEQDHYGLADIKTRILEFLAIRKLKRDRAEEFNEEITSDKIRRKREGVILCFIGPPGVGKTSLGQSISRAIGRKFIRISLGGIRDEAEIRGHRRTYIGAMPGRVIQSLRRVGSNNPVFMLDEVDKLTQDFQGDPSSALLEVLDPEQNFEFRDNYLEIPFDLSNILFITTANQLDTIPLPLRDRMEIIHLSGYTEEEKLVIAKNYLVPRQLKENGLFIDEITFHDDAIKKIIRQYTREAGVRNLERNIGSICRKIATKITEKKKFPNEITASILQRFLGKPKYFGQEEVKLRTQIPGVATGLAWTPFGGDVLFVEASKMPGHNGFKITGSIGTVMQESAQAALSFVRGNAKKLGLSSDIFDSLDLHLHVPAGSQPKDGPSAGITIATALISLLTEKTIRPDVAMTGELTLSGQVLPVGGIKEKILAAYQFGIKTVILPKLSQNDLDDLPEDVRKNMRFVFVETMSDVLANCF